ncbi:glycine zipper domain-containing protein [Rhizobium sp. TRM95111]|uniref:glycine zipper domain-containing protein n=1 Tax=Rhizobium alarense TaxID=2846851 RepID=UPI001F317DAC|nr:glycine zipper domain-containing protein [Rhizobium alarense]MCF3640843.1 glycine zipper domain-containing protein [Rhizobium alarense]
MRLIILATAAAVTALTLSSCTRTERGTTIGAASGAIIGGAVTGDVGGAAAGAVVGGAAGYLISRGDDGRCVYRDRYGRRYTAPCR